jgi:hypothetical protein
MDEVGNQNPALAFYDIGCYSASAEVVKIAKISPQFIAHHVFALVRLGCFSANAFFQACRLRSNTGGFGRISRREYPSPTENRGAIGVNGDRERCDGSSAATGLGNASQIAIPAVPAHNGSGRHHA